MPFLSEAFPGTFSRPMLGLVLGNTLLSTVPGISGAGPGPEKTVLTPILDSEVVQYGRVTSMPFKPNTPTGCPTPATITRSMMELTKLAPVFINAGMTTSPHVPCIDVYGDPGNDPRFGDAVPRARDLFVQGRLVGCLLGQYSDLLVLGECVPGGTTTSLCVLRALGYHARVSSSFIDNPHGLKDEVCKRVMERIEADNVTDPLEIVRYAGDPMIAVAAGIASAYSGQVVLAGGTQMLSVAAILGAMNLPMPSLATTAYVRDDPTASFADTLREVGTKAYYVDPDFGELGHAGLARYCIGEVKEGMGAGGAMFLAFLMGYSPERITNAILEFVRDF
jgi:uncharacterized protein (TIGR00303 family)